MANRKINELQSRTPALSDLMIVGDPSSGYSYKCTITALATIIETDIADGYVTIGTTQTISGAKTFSNNLTLTSVANATTTQTKFLTLNGSNVVNYRTGAEVLSDIGGQASLSGTGLVKSTSGTISYITDNSSNWNTAYNDSIVSAAVSGTTTKTLTLTQQDGGTLTASWSDLNTDAVTSVFGRTGAVVATEGDYSLNLLSDVTLTSPSNGQVLKYNGTAWVNDTDANTGTVTSVGLSSATSGVTIGSTPITTSGTITLAIATASGSQQGLLSSTDWTTFNNKQNAITLTTTGNSGAATLVGATLNIPNYTLSGLGGISGSGTTNYIPKFTSSSAIGTGSLYDDGTNIGLGTTTPDNFTNYRVFEVKATTGGILQSSNGTQKMRMYVTGQGTYFGSVSNDFLVFNTNDVERMRLTSGGSLGIGTSNPSELLSILGTGDTKILVETSKVGADANAALSLKTASDGHWIIQAGNAVSGGLRYVQVGYGERMRLDASGNLGLGTTAPNSKMEILRTSAGAITSQLLLHNGSDNDGTGARLDFSGLVDGSIATGSLANVRDGAGLYSLRFYTFGAGSANNERMRLDASGNLGLGVTPSAWGSGRKAFQIGSYSSLHDVSGYTILGNNVYNNGTNNIYLNTAAASQYYMQGGQHIWEIAPSGTAGNTISFTQAMTLFSTGNLAVGGTSDNGYRLNVTGSGYFSGAAPSLVINTTNTSGGALIFQGTGTYNGNSFALFATGSGNGAGANKFAIYDNTNNAHRLVIDNAGNVGIGTTSPNALLQLSKTDLGRINITHTNTTSTRQSDILFSEGTTNQFQIGTILGSGVYSDQIWLRGIANLPMTFLTNDAERMRITSNGSVLINTTTQAGSNGGLNLNVTSSGAETVPLAIMNRGTANNTTATISFRGLTAASAENDYAYIKMIETNTTTPASDLAFWTQSGSLGERMRITSGGNVGIGTSSPGFKLDVQGGSIVNGNGTIQTALTYATMGIVGTLSNHHLALYTNNTEKARITSGGDVGIGVTSPGAKLEVNGAIKTAAPSGGNAAAWKLGERVASSSLTLNTTQYIQLDINGTLYTLATVNLS